MLDISAPAWLRSLSTVIRLDWKAIFGRLGEQPHDADFKLMKCDRCAHQYLVDNEVLKLYLDPTLREHIFMIEGKPWPQCRGCGAEDWDLLTAEVPAPEWSWAVAASG